MAHAAVAALLLAPAAQAAQAGLVLPAQDLASALRQLAAQNPKLNLLFDAARMQGKRSQPVSGAPNADAALRDMLVGTGFIVQRSRSGALLVVPAEAAPVQATRDAELASDIPAVPEILVLGSRSLNAAIHRSEDDIQPYMVFSSDTLAASQSETVEEFLRARDPNDAQAGALTQAPVANGGAPRSQINLGGLGSAQTLVLVDGRRMPSIPGLDVFQQGDLNGIPTSAVDRIESLTSTAGGIYGPGATGGVINVILKHEYDGGAIQADGGGTTRGDAPQFRVSANWGKTFNQGKTRIMLVLSHSEDAGLSQGQRSFTVEADRSLLAAKPFNQPFISANLNIHGFGQLSPGSDSYTNYETYKPLNLPLASGGLAALYANMGKLDTSLSPDGQGALQSLLTRTKTNSMVLDLRQSLTSRIEFFVQSLYFQELGVATGPRTQPTSIYLDSDAGPTGSPFPGFAELTFPTPGWAADSADNDQTLRVTVGGIFRAAGGWNGEADLTWGHASDTARIPALLPMTGDPTSINLFDTGAGIASLYPAAPPDEVVKQVNDMLDASLRLSGPLWQFPGGPVTMTVLGEFRREYQPNAFSSFTNYDTGQVIPISLGFQSQSVGSGSAELRAPLLPKERGGLLRGLEVQLAGRLDDETTTVPADAEEYVEATTPGGVSFRGRAQTFALTAGVRAFPLDGLMLRASVATGFLPPSAEDLIEGVLSSTFIPLGGVTDPERGNTLVGAATPVTYELHGSPNLKPEQARTISVGLVATPHWASGLRLSLDYTRIDKTREITDFADSDFQFFLDHEAEFPTRVTRAPLTAADAARGYTGGVVTNIDTTPLNIGRTTVQTLDLEARYERDTRFGRFQLYTRATWEPDYRVKDDPDYGAYQTAGHIDGPLTFRGDGGMDWSSGQWSAGVNVEAYGQYSVTYAQPSTLLEQQNMVNVFDQFRKGAVPPQAYVDLQLAYRQPIRSGWGMKSILYRVGVHDVLDTQPPLLLIPVTATQPAQSLSYSPYGDPRGRRIEVSMTGTF